MYFDEKPKRRKEDLFNREEELNKLLEAIDRDDKLILILGQRRLGKTSLLLVALNTCNYPFMVIDGRRIEEKYSRLRLYELIAKGIEEVIHRTSHYKSLISLLRSTRGVDVKLTAGVISVNLKWRGTDRAYLSDILESLDKWCRSRKTKIVFAVDEAQCLRGPLSREFTLALAYAYDNLDNIVVVLTGSEVGLLYDIVGVDNPRHPLHGRTRTEITLRKFTREESRLFLKEGFKQIGLKVSEDVIDYAISKLDGVPGWLTAFGAKAWKTGRASRELVDQVSLEAVRLTKQEIEKLLRKRAIAYQRYRLALKAIACGCNTWSKVKEYIERYEGKIIPDNRLYNIIVTLMKTGIIVKEDNKYKIVDDITREAIIRL